MAQLTGAWTRYATKAIHDYAVAIASSLNHLPAHVTIERAAELAAWEALRVAALPGYAGVMLEVAKDLEAIREERDVKAKEESQREALQLGDMDEGEILRFPSVDGPPSDNEVGTDKAS